MTCTECKCNLDDDIDFDYCGYSMCTMPVCSNCAVVHALKEAFQILPKSDEQKNRFLNRVLADYKILRGEKK